MSDNDFIRRGDAARAVALCSAESDSPNAHFVCRQAVNAIRAIPAAEAEAAALRAKVARLEGAGDFARLIGNDDGNDDKDTALVSYGMLRRLRAALTDGGKDG